MINGAMEKLIPILSKGLDMLFNSVFAKVLAATGNAIVAYAAGVAAQTAMIGPVKAVQNILECIVNQVVGKILEPIKDILKSVADNIRENGFVVEVFATFVTTRNLMTGKEFQERYDTPYHCSPRSESFWSN